MKKLSLCCFLLTLPMTLIAADRDVNRDGRINQADVTALARMVAGLDQVDLRYDQDGDRTLTLEDVNHLLDAIPPQPESGSGNTAQVAAQNSSSGQMVGGIAFYAVRQKTTGQCVVVAGDEGISAGDTIYGVFPSFQEAQDLITNTCSQTGPTAKATAIIPGLPLSNDRIYKPDETITRGKWGTVIHLGEDAVLMKKIKEPGIEVVDGFFVTPGHGGDSEILWSHDGTPLTLAGTATVIDCIDYCGRSGSIEYIVRGDGRDLWTSGVVRQGDTAKPFAISLSGIRELRLVATSGGNGVDEDWGAWFNLSVGVDQPLPQRISAPPAANVTAEGASPVIAIPEFGSDDSTRGIVLVHLEDGHAVLIDQVRRSALDVGRRPMKHNFFDAVGRPQNQPAGIGQLLVGAIREGGGKVHALLIVDTTTGKMGYLTGLDDDPRGRNLKRINGAPAESLTSPDGNFTLVMRQKGSGKTVDAYLIHGTTGRGALFRDIGDLRGDIRSTAITALPKTQAGVSSLEIQSGSDATSHFLLIDQVGGAVHHVGGVSKKPTQLTVRTLPHNLVRSFPKNPSVPFIHRFATIPVTDRSGATDSALIIDVGSGAMAMIENLGKPSKTRLIGVNRSIYEVLPKEVGEPRNIAGIPRINSNAATEGGWLLDSASAEILFLDKIHDPDRLFMGKVEISDSH